MRFFENILLILVLTFLSAGSLMGQRTPAAASSDTTKVTKINVNFSDIAEGYKDGDEEIRKLIGNVELRQDSVFLTCDTAILNLNDNAVVAIGDVVIQQGDSLNIFADSLIYDGNKKVANLYGEVILVNNEKKIFTDFLTYNLNTKAATYTNGAVLTDGNTQITSEIGYYYAESGQAFFKEKVTIVDDNFELRADTLNFNTESRIATFLGPTRIDQGEAKIYCEDGFYDLVNNKAEFRQNTQYVKGTQVANADIMTYDGALDIVTLEGNAAFQDEDKNATADIIKFNQSTKITELLGNAYFEDDTQTINAESISYNEETKKLITEGSSVLINPPQFLSADQIDFDDKTGLGVAKGNVFWQDSVQQVIIKCDQVDYMQEEDYLKAYGERTLLISILDGDSLFMTTDTLVYTRSDSFYIDSTKKFTAFEDVRLLKSDFQAVCDSLVFDQRDSIFHFYKNPIIWSDTSQFSADTISMKMTNGELDSIFLMQKSFIINTTDNYFYNQIKGRDITALFEENEIYEMNVYGNAESVYYLMDENNAYIAVNKAVCSDMIVDFGNNKVEKIKCFPNPKAELTPIMKANHNELKLEGFYWETIKRPLKISDLF